MKSQENSLSGRSLNTKATTAGANFKFAIKFAKDFSPNSNGADNPSVAKVEDMLIFVCQKMFVEFQEAKDQKGFIRAKKDLAKKGETLVVKNEDDMPSDYFFTGYFAFALYGPQGFSKVALSFLSADNQNVPKTSRKEAHQLELKEKEAERLSGARLPHNYN